MCNREISSRRIDWSFPRSSTTIRGRSPGGGGSYQPPPLTVRVMRNALTGRGGRNLSMRGPTRPNPTQPYPVTLLRSLYLWNGLTDSQAVFFVRYHHSINFVFDRHRYPPVPATARGTCWGEGVGDTLSIGNFTTAGSIAFKFGVCLETG